MGCRKTHTKWIWGQIWPQGLRNIASRLGLSCPRPRLQTANQARGPVGPRDWFCQSYPEVQGGITFSIDGWLMADNILAVTPHYFPYCPFRILPCQEIFTVLYIVANVFPKPRIWPASRKNRSYDLCRCHTKRKLSWAGASQPSLSTAKPGR